MRVGALSNKTDAAAANRMTERPPTNPPPADGLRAVHAHTARRQAVLQSPTVISSVRIAVFLCARTASVSDEVSVVYGSRVLTSAS